MDGKRKLKREESEEGGDIDGASNTETVRDDNGRFKR